MTHRRVEINGVAYTEHELVIVEHRLTEGTTVATVRSDGELDTAHALPLMETATREEVEAAVMALPYFAECEDKDALVDELASILTDKQALSVPTAFRPWDAEASYAEGERVRFGGALYKCLQAHDAQDGWEPTAAPSLWAAMLVDPEADEVPEWVQPDSTNAYAKGDRVTFDGKVYESLIDNNVWSPADYPAGWQEVA
jgi:hypothetical protein